MEQKLELAAVTILPDRAGNRYEGMAFDGEFFYLTLPSERKICRFSRDFIFLQSLEIERPYAAICYDSTEHCFWASLEHNPLMLYGLDSGFGETKKVSIKKCCAVSSPIRSLSVNDENLSITAAYENCVIEVSKDDGTAQVVHRPDQDVNLCVLSLPPLLVLVQRCKHQQFLKIFCGGELTDCLGIPECYTIKAVIFCCCCGRKDEKLVLFLLAMDSCGRPCILKCVVTPCKGMPCNCHPGCSCKDRDCSCEIIESIAKSECALAHILNAEGEKLQKAVELAGSICELLEINRSVQKTITKVTFLEQVLYAKLEAALECDLDPCEKE